MKRRAFIALLSGAVLTPLAARAQQAGRVPAVGVLMAGSESGPVNPQRIAAFRKELQRVGWTDGENVHAIYHWSAGKEELIHRYANELVALAPDVILANSTSVLAEFKSITATVPVVFALAVDPVGLGVVQSLSHPGRNFTGFTFIEPALFGKWMQLLKNVMPGMQRAGVVFNPATSPFYPNFLAEAAWQRDALELVPISVGSMADAAKAITALAQSPNSGLMLGPGPIIQVNIKQLAQLTNDLRLPTVSVYRPFPVQGGLMGYGPDTPDIFRRSAGYVDRILKGAKPADLPVQQPDKFEFVINLKTAKTLGLDIPPTLLALADEVIE